MRATAWVRFLLYKARALEELMQWIKSSVARGGGGGTVAEWSKALLLREKNK